MNPFSSFLKNNRIYNLNRTSEWNKLLINSLSFCYFLYHRLYNFSLLSINFIYMKPGTGTGVLISQCCLLRAGDLLPIPNFWHQYCWRFHFALEVRTSWEPFAYLLVTDLLGYFKSHYTWNSDPHD